MLFDPLFERFAAGTALTVMTRALLENTLQAQPLDDLFERRAVQQYTRELLFSTAVATMTRVACRFYKSPRSVYAEHKGLVGVTPKCFYEKLRGIELPVVRERVKDHARRCAAVIEELGGRVPTLLPGYRLKILDGNALAGTDHRSKELRQSTAAALPGKSLVVLDPALGLAIDVSPCEAGHARERSLIAEVLDTAEVKALWIEDRNFCPLGFILGVAQKGGFLLVRAHKGVPWQAESALRYIGRTRTGRGYEQQVVIRDEDGRALELRRVIIRLGEPTRDDETEVALLTNVRGVRALPLAKLDLERRSIERLSNVLTTTLLCEQNGLGYPEAALFGFCVARLAYNVLASVKAALRGAPGSAPVEAEGSLPKVAEQVSRNYEGMLVGLPAVEWRRFRSRRAADLAACLLQWAAKVCLEKVRKATSRPRKKGGPKPVQDPSTPHVSTARLLAARRQQQ